MRVRHLVRIYEHMDLRAFPFDFQNLNISIVSKLARERAMWKFVDAGAGGEAKLRVERCLFHDFDLLRDYPYTSHLAINDDDPKRQLWYVHVQVKVCRISTFYLLNVSLVIFVITSFSFCAWSVHPGDIQGRHDTDFTIILTAIAFKLVVADMLPNVSYVTKLDFYVMMCLFMLCIVTICHTILPHCFYTHLDMSALTRAPVELDDEQSLIDADYLSFYTLLIIWLLFNVSYWPILYFNSRKQHKRFREEAEEEQRKHLENGVSSRSSAISSHALSTTSHDPQCSSLSRFVS